MEIVIRYLLPFVLAAMLSGCATSEVDRRLEALEDRVDALAVKLESLERAQQAERDQTTPTPCINEKEIRSQINVLRSERAKLSVKYTDAHPTMRELSRQIRYLEQRLERIDSTAEPCGVR